MPVIKEFVSLLPRNINRAVGQAMHTYNMLADGDRIMVAVSGGIDSLVLAWLLDHWRKKAPIDYTLLAVHLNMGFDADGQQLVEKQLCRLGVPCLIKQTSYGREALAAEDGKSGCFHCARKRRNRLFELAGEHDCNKIAFGHHQEDIIETFFLNLLYSGNLSTMVPRQNLFGGKLAIIRPLAFLGKKQIQSLGERLGIDPVKNPCPLAESSKRSTVRSLLTQLYMQDETMKASIFAALANVRTEYLLTPLDKDAGPQNHANHP